MDEFCTDKLIVSNPCRANEFLYASNDAKRMIIINNERERENVRDERGERLL